ncbi:transcriptional regulator [Acetobacter nitrogenifigens DSM 23921 = NBRC 105050]|uniref:TetR family transcriptional regulator n=1 Tax=Acetobacter nitrogenifigens DSM 23921 = NBRC 105050 TaxID=1120919 RepID=A0A511XEY7_9PROT|nr:transcriptional regulator [Acetobacter nitrogenifigens DSM 23921 = NBRC 105050]GEN61461.1 TetR family transcriptional regulator [Acetobacter nitrogenifigens DSM 23921 = NBRC 105050]
MRADAQRSLESLLEAAKEVFAASGVNAPIREITGKAGLSIGTVYRHFPQRSDLIAAVFRREIDDCADAAIMIAARHEPFEALRLWMQRFSAFFATKRGLAAALHSGEPAYAALPDHFEARLRPTLDRLLKSAADAGQIRSDVAANELLGAIARLSMSDIDGPLQAQRMVALLADGLRVGV